MEYVTIGGYENKTVQMTIKKPKCKFWSLLVVNIIHLFLTIVIAISFAIVIYNLIIFRDNVDIQKQLEHLDTITITVDDFMEENKQFFNQTKHFISQIETIIQRLCKIDPQICAS